SVDSAREPSVREVVIDGTACVIKRRRAGLARGISYALRYVRALFLAVGCKLFLGEFPRPSVLLRNGLPYEAQRLRALAQAGCRVPHVWREAPGLLVLEHVGADLAGVLRPGAPGEGGHWASRPAMVLAQVPSAGDWPGG